MAGAKARSGGARPGSGGARVGAGRKPSEKTLFARNFVGPPLAKRSRARTAEEKDEARRLRSLKKSARISAQRELERQALGIQKYQRTTSHEGYCLCCGSHFVAKLSSAKYCSTTCRVRLGNASPDKAQKLKCKYQSDPLFNLKVRVRKTVRMALQGKGFTKTKRSQEILGCTWDEFRRHIERQFTRGMSWERRSEIHLDHIVPLATAKTEEDVVRLNHFTNLRPIWAKDNLSKGAQITHLI